MPNFWSTYTCFNFSFPTYLILSAALMMGPACTNDNGSTETDCDTNADCDGTAICIESTCTPDTSAPDANDEDTWADGDSDADTNPNYPDADSDADPDTSETCPTDQTECDGTCTDIRFDPNNCGACGTVCVYGACEVTECVIACDPDQTPFGGGHGTEEFPYTLCSATHLQNIGEGEYLADQFLQFSDIELDDVEFTPIGSEEAHFSGHLDGNGFEIQNLSIGEPSDTSVGFFSFIGEAGVVTDVRLSDVNINGESLLGGLAAINFGRIENTSVSGIIQGQGNQIGGLVGQNDESGIVYTSNTTVAVSGIGEIGGLVGANYGSIDSSFATEESIGSGRDVGGLVGMSEGDISQSFATGAAISPDRNVGGLVGMCRNECTIEDSYARGNAQSSTRSVGGLVGSLRNDSLITRSYAEGDVTLTDGVFGGGLAGDVYATSLVVQSFASGSVNAPSANGIGGLIGGLLSDSTVHNSYAIGEVFGDTAVGGLTGGASPNTTISNCYSTGYVTGETDVGGLNGEGNGGDVENSYWHGLSSGQFESAGGISLTTAQMANPDFFIDWDFDDIWEMSDTEGRPILQWQE